MDSTTGDDFEVDIDIEVWKPGPLLLQLQIVDNACVVIRFERGPEDLIGEVQQDGRVSVGDSLVTINEIDINGMSLDEIRSVIISSVKDGLPRKLRFRRKAAQVNTSSPTLSLTLPAATATFTESPSTPPSTPTSPANKLYSLIPMRRIDVYHSILQDKLINEGKLRNLAASGVPDHQGIRGVVWRLLLRVLPLDTDSWASTLIEKRSLYNDWCSSYFIGPTSKLITPTSDEGASSLDHPLSDQNNILWKAYMSDIQLMEEIEKDVIRTHPDISFFIDEDNALNVKSTMMRILYVFAKRHPNVRYVQGMNDLCGTLFYVFGTDESLEWREYAEVDAYFCFESLVLENQDMFIKTLDETETGIHGRIQQFIDLLRIHDNEIFVLFRKQGIDPSFYGLRWLTTLLCREFNLADTIRVWDSLFADTDRTEFLSYVCCTMVIEQRDKLIEGDFAVNLQLLQAYPHVDVIHLLSKATKLRSSDRLKTLGDSSEISNDKMGFNFNWVDSVFMDDDSPIGEQASFIRHPRLSKALGLGANIISQTGSSMTLLFNSAEAGVRKLFSEKSSSSMWPNLFQSNSTASQPNEDI